MIISKIIKDKNRMFWTKEVNDKISKVNYLALAIDFNMKVDGLYEYDDKQGNIYRISYGHGLSNHLHRLLKFKLQKRFVVIEKDDDMLTIVGHYDEMIIQNNNQMIVDLQNTQYINIKV